MNIGENIKRIRKVKGISQKDLAKKLSVSQQNLSQYESGKRKPKLETIAKIAIALDVPLDSIIRDSPMDLLKDIDDSIGLQLKEDLLISGYRTLNEKGQDKALQYIDDLKRIPQYRSDILWDE